MHGRVSQMLSQRLVTAEGSIALLTAKGRGMYRRVSQVLLQSLIAAENLITLFTGMEHVLASLVGAVAELHRSRRLDCRFRSRRTEHARASLADAAPTLARYREIDHEPGNPASAAPEPRRCQNGGRKLYSRRHV
jgi:hypothetical protein